MRKSKLFSVIIVLLTISVVSSCKKEPDDIAPSFSNKKLLSGKNWMLIDFTIDTTVVGIDDLDSIEISLISPLDLDIDTLANGEIDLNLFAHMELCDQDNLWSFTTDNTYKREEGSRKCSTVDPQVIGTGVWVFNSDETTFIADVGNPEERVYAIVKLELGTLIVAYEFEHFIYTLTYTH